MFWASCGPEAGDVREQLLAGGVDLDADAVDAADDHVVEALLEHALVHVVLVLADADGLGIDLHQLGQRVHEPPADGDRAADGDVLVGELLAGDLRGGVDRRAALVDHDDGDAARAGGGCGRTSSVSRPAVPLPMAMASISNFWHSAAILAPSAEPGLSDACR